MTRYQRSPSVFSDSSLSLSFLRTTPAKNPRTLCCCHPVRLHDRGDSCALWLAQHRKHICLLVVRRISWVWLGSYSSTWVSPHRLRQHLVPSLPNPRGGRRRWRGVGERRPRSDQSFEIRLIRDPAFSSVLTSYTSCSTSRGIAIPCLVLRASAQACAALAMLAGFVEGLRSAS
jgi:hypothetical protein